MKCQGLSGLLFGHRYRPRYSYGTPTLAAIKGCPPWRAAEIIDASRPATYLCDICDRCGDIIYRTEEYEDQNK